LRKASLGKPYIARFYLESKHLTKRSRTGAIELGRRENKFLFFEPNGSHPRVRRTMHLAKISLSKASNVESIILAVPKSERHRKAYKKTQLNLK
jgi:hypothetical protein